MRLRDLEQYGPVTIQCHDNPDADALASGFGLYCYFTAKGIDTKLIYSGQNKIQKANLKLMVERLGIPVEYWKPMRGGNLRVEGLLITVDCQYGAGNVTKIDADYVAIIDHHQEEIKDMPLSRIHSKLGSCSTLVWSMLTEEEFPTDDTILGTALYYGLYMDTNQFAEVYNPLDMDMREALVYNKSLITRFRNSNLTLKELEIAGIAMIRYSFNDDYHFAVIKAQPCDPNILGLISDFLLQVDEIDTCVVYNQANDGYKLSVRSCIKEVNASELASFLTEEIGSGGGHIEKAGGSISLKLYEEKYPTLHSEAYFNNRMTDYFDSHEIIYARTYDIDVSQMKSYKKNIIPEGYVKADHLLPLGTPITIRTSEGDIDLRVEKDLYIVIGQKGEISPYKKEMFEEFYLQLDKKYSINTSDIGTPLYVPTIKNRADNSALLLTDYAQACICVKEVQIYAKPLEKPVKVFTLWEEERYQLGRPGDYLAVSCDDRHDIFVIEKEIFDRNYEKQD